MGAFFFYQKDKNHPAWHDTKPSGLHSLQNRSHRDTAIAILLGTDRSSVDRSDSRVGSHGRGRDNRQSSDRKDATALRLLSPGTDDEVRNSGGRYASAGVES
ncbi:unnamed protein product [Nesidiocoris tenuis]|uniref:Uncharacterized protein n=1 Tax=Nesidiocoris tenuis TaxID=355587 RepID=A0A6H5GTS3_9HEMI|nr:unnamed protein product [Nesidiocoris tenuis]